MAVIVKSERILWLDFIRFLAISCVLLLHTVDKYYNMWRYAGVRFSDLTFTKLLFLHQISLIGVPLFLMLSGGLILKEDLFNRKHLLRIFRLICSLIIAYVIYQPFVFIFKNIYKFDKTIFFTGIFTGNYIVGWGSWYLYTIIFLYIYKLLVNLNNKQLKLYLWLLFLFSIFLNTINVYFQSTKSNFLIFPYNVPGIPLSSWSTSFLLYFVLGYASFRRNLFKNINNLVLYFIYILSLIISLLIHLLWYKNYILYGKGLEIETLFTFMMSFSVLILLSRFENILNKININIKKLITSIAINSFGIYLLHGFFMIIIDNSHLNKIVRLNLSGQIFMEYIVVYILSFVSTLLLSKTPMRKILR